MKHKQETNVTYTPNENYYKDSEYLGYGGYRDMEGCRRLFLLFIGMLTAILIGGLVAVLL